MQRELARWGWAHGLTTRGQSQPTLTAGLAITRPVDEPTGRTTTPVGHTDVSCFVRGFKGLRIGGPVVIVPTGLYGSAHATRHRVAAESRNRSNCAQPNRGIDHAVESSGASHAESPVGQLPRGRPDVEKTTFLNAVILRRRPHALLFGAHALVLGRAGVKKTTFQNAVFLIVFCPATWA